MKKYCSLLLVSCFSFGITHAQVLYDECFNALDLGVVPSCDPTFFLSNTLATASDVFPDSEVTCFQNNDHDVWIQFTVSANSLSPMYTLDFENIVYNANSSSVSLQVALYRGLCPDEMYELYCFYSADGESGLSVDVHLTPSFTYYLRINTSYDTLNPGVQVGLASMWLCITNQLQANNQNELNQLRMGISPNPVSEDLLIQWYHDLQAESILKVTDAMGRFVYEEKIQAGQSSKKVSVRDLPKGIYTCRVLGANAQSVGQFVRN
jgi:hypothetical protein